MGAFGYELFFLWNFGNYGFFLAVSAIAGFVFGIVAAKYARIGLFFVGAWLGIIVVLVLNNAFIYKLTDSSQVLFLKY